MARWPQLLIVLALLGATAAAFAVTERLKLERSPVTGTRVDRVFSPVCECARDVAVISIVLRRRETVTLDILNRDGRSIRTIVRKRREPAGRVSYTWDGRDNLDRVVPEGVYRPRVQLERNGRTIVLPNPIRVDTTAPAITARPRLPARVLARLGRPPRPRDGVVPDRRARAGRDARRRPAARAEQVPAASRGSSSGSAASTAASFGPGLYEIRLRAVDRAGNRSRAHARRARARALRRALPRADRGRRRRSASRCACGRMRRRIAGCSTRAAGAGRREVLVLRAPEEPGTYTLYVTGGRTSGARRRGRHGAGGVRQPLVLLGVSRSGTTLLRVILDRSPGIAIPDESFFVPLLARRHGRTIDAEGFLDDVARIPTIRDWGLSVDDVAARVRSGMPIGEAIAAIFEAYAAAAGKPRWGDKTPMYMRHLELLDELFPDAQYVHLIRDGRDAALSFLQMPEGTFTRTWAHPTDAAEFACLWRKEVGDARALGRRLGASRYHEVRYEELVASPEETVREICAFAAIPFEPAMLDYTGAVDVSAKPHQQRLLDASHARACGAGARTCRLTTSAAFESVAGDLLSELGYDVESRSSGGRETGARRARGTTPASPPGTPPLRLVQRSPLWRRRHPRLSA